MISKPLFKQSAKANVGIWSFVTFITCFMLAVVILVLGNLHVGSIRDSMVDMFIEDAIESSIEKQSMTYYNMTNNALLTFDENVENLKNLGDAYKQARLVINTVNPALSAQTADAQAKNSVAENAGFSAEQKLGFENFVNFALTKNGEIDYSDYGFNSEEKASTYTLNMIGNSIYSQLLEEEGQETASSAKNFIESAINNYALQNKQEAISASDFSKSYIPNVLSNIFVDMTFDYNENTVIRVDKYFTKQELYDASHDAIVVFNAKLDDFKSGGHSDEEVALKAEEIINENAGSMFENLPENVTSSLTEISEMDVFSMVIGSIFYRIAGLLLPIIYIIMASNNLIANQVDKGSMAYILSTPTKRRKVMLTQLTFMISSLFAMFALTTITSVVCFAIVDTSRFTLSMTDILLFNVGAFVTTLAISGICFLTSAWFNRSKVSTSVGGGLSMFFLVATILGLFGSKIMPSAVRIEAMNYFNYVTIISLFDTVSITSGTLDFLWKWAILLVIAALAYVVGIAKFEKKDLPL